MFIYWVYQLIWLGVTLTFIRPINIRIQYKNVCLFSFYLLGIEKDHTILGLLSKISFHFHAQMGPFPALIKKNWYIMSQCNNFIWKIWLTFKIQHQNLEELIFKIYIINYYLILKFVFSLFLWNICSFWLSN